jgi:hypothetical protein
MAAAYPQRMSAGLRSAVMVTYGALWLSGCYWLILHFFFAQPTDFGPVQNPWAPLILRVHGWIAVAGVFLLGWVTARHVSDRWPQMIKRVSGISMLTVCVTLGLTGYGLYYTTDRLHDGAELAHEVIGAVASVFALTHWRRYKVAKRRSLPRS